MNTEPTAPTVAVARDIGLVTPRGLVLTGAEIEKLSDAELKARFWELANETVAPMVELARTHTSPSIERSVLMRRNDYVFVPPGVRHSFTNNGLIDLTATDSEPAGCSKS